MRDDGRDFCMQLSLPAFCSVLSHSSCKMVISKLKDYCVSNLQGFQLPLAYDVKAYISIYEQGSLFSPHDSSFRTAHSENSSHYCFCLLKFIVGERKCIEAWKLHGPCGLLSFVFWHLIDVSQTGFPSGSNLTVAILIGLQALSAGLAAFPLLTCSGRDMQNLCLFSTFRLLRS